MATQITVPEVRARKGKDPLVMVTAYDAPGAFCSRARVVSSDPIERASTSTESVRLPRSR